MKHVKDNNTIDAVADPEDQINVRIVKGIVGNSLYVDVNDITILRIGRITTQIGALIEE